MEELEKENDFLRNENACLKLQLDNLMTKQEC
jgi:hypothetical protein